MYIVSGPPCSGKNRFVDEKRGEHDLVVDVDALCHALGSRNYHGDHSHTLRAALDAREAVYKTIESRAGLWENAFVITSTPNAGKVSRLAARLRAWIVTMDTPMDECLRRVRKDETRRGCEEYFEQLIREWFAIGGRR